MPFAVLPKGKGTLLQSQRKLEMSTKQPLGRVSVPLDMIAEVRELAKFEHATLPQVVRPSVAEGNRPDAG